MKIPKKKKKSKQEAAERIEWEEGERMDKSGQIWAKGVPLISVGNLSRTNQPQICICAVSWIKKWAVTSEIYIRKEQGVSGTQWILVLPYIIWLIVVMKSFKI